MFFTASVVEAGNSLNFVPLGAPKKKSRASNTNEVRIVAGFDCSPTNLTVSKVAENHFTITFPTGSRDVVGWFMFKVENAAGKPLQIDLVNIPNSKWSTLNPVYSYAKDLARLDSFKAGRPASPGQKVNADNKQDIPDTSAENWHYMKGVKTKKRVMVLTHTFTNDHAYVAMRTPYTPHYNETLFKCLKNRQDVVVHEVGKSKEGRPLQLVQIGGLTPEAAQKNPCIVIYAREHADEQDTSWAAEGTILHLLTPAFKPLRDQVTFLIVPMLDPDGAVHCQYENITKNFLNNAAKSTESVAWAQWFREWVIKGNRLDLLINLHNVESREASNIVCALVEPDWGRQKESEFANKAILDFLEKDSVYKVDKKPWKRGFTCSRIGGYLTHFYGCLQLPYEVNSQAPGRHLSLYELRELGIRLAQAALQHLTSPEAKPLLATIDNKRAKRLLLWDRYAPIRAQLEMKKNPFKNEASLPALASVEQLCKDEGRLPDWLKPIYASGDARQDNIPQTWLPAWWDQK